MPKKTMITLAAVASAVGLLVVPAPAEALPGAPFPQAPACTQWEYYDAALFLDLDNGVRIGVPWIPNSPNVRAGNSDARLMSPDGGVWEGTAEGPGVVGGSNKLDFTIAWYGDPTDNVVHTNTFSGSLTETGVAAGVTTDEKGGTYRWSSGTPFSCAELAAAPADPAPADSRATYCTDTGITVPPGETCPPSAAAPVEQPPTEAVRMTIAVQPPNVKISVGSTANITGECTLTANEVNGLGPARNESFTLGPKGSKEFTFPAPILAQRYHVVASCRGDFNGQNVEFGRQEQDVTAFG